MFTDDAAGLYREVMHAIDFRDQFLGSEYEDDLRRFVGPDYRGGWHGHVETDLENIAFQWMALFIAKTASGNPRVKITSPDSGMPQAVAEAITYTRNRHWAQTDRRALNEKLAMDWGFRWAVALTLPEPTGAHEENGDSAKTVRHRANSYRISIRDFFQDHMAIEQELCRFRGHRIREDKEDLMERAKKDKRWNKEAIMALKEDADPKGREGQREMDYRLPRGEVSYFEIWVREYELDSWTDDDGKKINPKTDPRYTGTVFTVAEHGNYSGDDATDFLYPPRPFFGPADGPYEVDGYMLPPDEIWPLSLISATRAQSEELNTHRHAISKHMANYKKMVLVEGTDPDLQEKILDSEDLYVVPIEGLDKIREKVMEVELAGINQVLLAQLEYLSASADRAIGMTEAMKGQVTGAGTATESSQAQGAADLRTGFMEQKFRAFLGRVARKEAWYDFHDPRSYSASPERQEALEMQEDGTVVRVLSGFEVKGGESKDVNFEDYTFDIDAFSIGYTSEQTQAMRAQEIQALIANYGPLMPQMPFFNWAEFWQREGERLGMPDLHKLFDTEKANMLGYAMMGMQAQGPAPQAQNVRMPQDKAPGSSGQTGGNFGPRPITSKSPSEMLSNQQSQGGPSQTPQAPQASPNV